MALIVITEESENYKVTISIICMEIGEEELTCIIILTVEKNRCSQQRNEIVFYEYVNKEVDFCFVDRIVQCKVGKTQFCNRMTFLFSCQIIHHLIFFAKQRARKPFEGKYNVNMFIQFLSNTASQLQGSSGIAITQKVVDAQDSEIESQSTVLAGMLICFRLQRTSKNINEKKLNTVLLICKVCTSVALCIITFSTRFSIRSPGLRMRIASFYINCLFLVFRCVVLLTSWWPKKQLCDQPLEQAIKRPQ